MRLFVALELPDPWKAYLAGWRERVQARSPVSWVKPENYHLTVQFLGHVLSPRVPELSAALAAAAKSLAPFSMQLGAPGVFPSRRRPRVLWVSAEPAEVLRALARTVQSALEPHGFAAETRPFQAHITLARARHSCAPEFAELSGAADPPAPLPVRELSLMQSQLHPQGAIYTTLGRFPLDGATRSR